MRLARRNILKKVLFIEKKRKVLSFKQRATTGKGGGRNGAPGKGNAHGMRPVRLYGVRQV
jgi:hypothetical protein